MTSDKVSIIIPVPTATEHLSSCLDSIKLQTAKPAEVIVVATQGTAVETINGAKLIWSTKTKSAEILNEIVPVTEGDLLLVLSPDDLLAPTHLEENTKLLRQHNCDGVFGAVRVFDDVRMVSPAPEKVVDLLASPAQPLSFLFRRTLFNALKGYDPSSSPFELTDFAARALQSSDRLKQSNSPLYFYRAKMQTNAPSSFEGFVACHAGQYNQHLAEILQTKDRQLRRLTGQLAPQCERLRSDLESLRFEHEAANRKYESLAEHHRQALSSIKVTFTHLLKAISSRFLPRVN